MRPAGVLGTLAALWGFGGVAALILNAVVRLSPRAVEAVLDGLTWWQWAITIGWTAFMLYTEGYRGFHLRFSPMVVARTLHLARQPTVVRVLLAPAFVMGLFHATRRRLILSWGLIIGITILVILVRLLPQPWRGIVDAGVVIGLVVGLLSMAVVAAGAVLGRPPAASPELPAAG